MDENRGVESVDRGARTQTKQAIAEAWWIIAASRADRAPDHDSTQKVTGIDTGPQHSPCPQQARSIGRSCADWQGAGACSEPNSACAADRGPGISGCCCGGSQRPQRPAVQRPTPCWCCPSAMHACIRLIIPDRSTQFMNNTQGPARPRDQRKGRRTTSRCRSRSSRSHSRPAALILASLGCCLRLRGSPWYVHI